MAAPEAFQARVDAVLDRVDIEAVVRRGVALNRSGRGKCPFHGSKSDSFAVVLKPRRGGRPYARCYGCGWHGHAVRFVADFYGLDFVDALERLEADHGLDSAAPSPVRREKQAQAPGRRSAPAVDSATMGRFIWNAGKPDLDAIRTWFRARGVPDAMLSADRLRQLRFCARAPVFPWREGSKPGSVPQAPAIAAMIRRPPDWAPIGVHATFLEADLKAKLDRRGADGGSFPARLMLGEAGGGAVLLGRLTDGCPLFAGEGLETVLWGMALAGSGPDACGLAALSLGNLQGDWVRWKNGVTPLYDIRPDPKAPPIAFAHDGPVTGLIDADMKPLRGPVDRETGRPRGVPVVEHRGGPIVRRTITTAERALICADLFVKAWRREGCRRVKAVRPRMGLDFDDAGRELAGAVGVAA